jgi:FtsH-binding integral membrane protein
LALFINSYYSSKFLNYSTGKQLTDLVPTILIVGLTLVIVLILNEFIDSTSLIVQIFQSFIIGLFVLVVLSEIIALKPYNIFKELILEKLRK